MKIVQAVEELHNGDAVGNDVVALNRMLIEAGYSASIISNAVSPSLCLGEIERLDALQDISSDDVVLLHFATSSWYNYEFVQGDYTKILVYHNITPPHFFKPYSLNTANHCRLALNEVRYMADKVDYAIADSEFNKQDLIEYGFRCPIDVVPVLVPFDDFRRELPFELKQNVANRQSTKILFVGRVAPNKCFEDVIRAFACYQHFYEPQASLTLVGAFDDYDWYYTHLKAYTVELGVSGRVHFTRHIPFEEILAHYATADIFLCQSEHEGFCVPLIESMLFDVPIVAYESSAIPYTLGGSGVCLSKKDAMLTAGVINRIVHDEKLRQQIILGQKKRLEDFSYNHVKEQFLQSIEKAIANKEEKNGKKR